MSQINNAGQVSAARYPRRSPKNAKHLRQSIPVLFGCFVLFGVYQYLYLTYSPVPGNDPNYPLGWWGWFDQGEYIKSARAFLAWDFSANQHFYPPLYPFLGSLFLPFSKASPFYLVNLFLMLGYFVVLVLLFGRYTGWWGAAVCGLAGMVFFRPLQLQWVIPWTTTPGAFLIICALFLLDRYVRMRNEPDWTIWAAAINAACFGLAVGLQAPLRPGDLAVVSPVAITYAVLVLNMFFAGAGHKRAAAIASMFGGIAGFAIPVGLMLLFNSATVGSVSGGYFGTVIATHRFDPLTLPNKLFSHLLASQVFYGEQNADWLSKIPIVLIAVLFVPIAVFKGPIFMRAAAAAALLQFAIYNSYSDLLPTGTFRYFNIHYFKWLPPVAFCVVYYFVVLAVSRDNGLKRQGRAALAAGFGLGMLIVSVDAVQTVKPILSVEREGQEITFELTGGPVDFVDLIGVKGAWNDVYFAWNSRAVLDGSKPLAAFRDYRLLPIENGVRILFFRPIEAKRITVFLGDKLTFPEPITPAQVQPVQVNFRLGLPLGQQDTPAQPSASM